MKTDQQLRQSAANKLVDSVYKGSNGGSLRDGPVQWSARSLSFKTDTSIEMTEIMKLREMLQASEVYLSADDQERLEVCFESVGVFPWER